MAETTYSYTISTDFPSGAVNIAKLKSEIEASTIVTALDRIDVTGDNLGIVFKDALSAGDKTTLDGDTTGPAGGLIAAHDNTASPSPTLVDINNNPVVHPKKSTTGVRVYSFGQDFCDKTTWYYSSARVFEESVGTGDGTTTVFNMANANVIDLTHGKITEENAIAAPSAATGETPDPTDWKPIIKVNGVTKTERIPFAASGGDYTLDYATGQITFAVAPPNTEPVVATYSYENGSTYEFGPPPAGKKWTIDITEAQLSKDVVINDTINFAPYIGSTQVGVTTAYKTLGNFLDFTYGSFPIIPAMGGSSRGLTQDIIILRWEYLSPIVLTSANGLKLRVWLEGDNIFTGERCTATMYALEEDE